MLIYITVSTKMTNIQSVPSIASYPNSVGAVLFRSCTAIQDQSSVKRELMLLARCVIWQYRFWSFQGRDTKLERFLFQHQDQHTQIRHDFRK